MLPLLLCFVLIPLVSPATSAQNVESACQTINHNHFFLHKNKDEPNDCSEIQSQGYNKSGVYTIFPDDWIPKIVYCDLTTDGGGWLVIQRRMDGSENFYRKWSDYKLGFGNPTKEFWLGNDVISLLTNQQLYELRFDLEDYKGVKKYATYKPFSIASDAFKYKVSIGEYSGDAGDSFLKYHNNMKFSTQDQDNDIRVDAHNALLYKGAWWYAYGHESNLNGLYVPGGTHATYADGINWKDFHGFYYSLKWTEMKIRPLAFKSTSKVGK